SHHARAAGTKSGTSYRVVMKNPDKFRTGPGVPHSHDPARSGHDARALWAEAGVKDHTVVSETGVFCATGYPPYPSRLVPGGGVHPRAVQAEGGGGHCVVVGKESQLCTSRGVPYPCRLVSGGGDHPVAIRAEGGVIDLVVMSKTINFG